MPQRKGKSSATKRVYAAVVSAMKAVIREEETSNRVFSDDKMSDRIRARGVFTTPTITNLARVEAGVPVSVRAYGDGAAPSQAAGLSRGGDRIRTCEGRIRPLTAFEAVPFVRSGTPPGRV